MRTRASAPKARTGCVTCKKRHVKCDEGKPICLKCLKGGYTCDGYPAIPLRKPRASKKLEALSKPKFQVQFAASSPWQVVLNEQISHSLPEAELIHHVQTCTVHELGMGLFPTEFWQLYVLPLSHNIEPIKHALSAFGTAHRYFKFQYGGVPIASCSIQKIETSCLYYYNRAIDSLSALTGPTSITSIKTILICCILFVCIENLLGRYDQSLHHIRAGCALFISFRQRLIEDFGCNWPGTAPELVKTISYMLSLLAQDVFIYSGVDVAPQLYSSLPFELDRQDEDAQFTSVEEASHSLFRIETEYSARICTENKTKKSQPCTGPEPAPSYEFGIRSVQTSVMARSFERWSQKFERLCNDSVHKSTPNHEAFQMQLLRLEQALWVAFLDNQGLDGMKLESCRDILKEIKAWTYLRDKLSSPIFTLDSHIIPTIGMVCVLSKDREIQQEGLSLLRALRIREGVWESKKVADVIEHVVWATDNKILCWSTIPWNIPELMKLASSLPVRDFALEGGRKFCQARD